MLITRPQAAMPDEVCTEGNQFVIRVRGAFGQIPPNRLRPAGIIRCAADNVKMQLRHEIAKGTKVNLGKSVFLSLIHI